MRWLLPISLSLLLCACARRSPGADKAAAAPPPEAPAMIEAVEAPEEAPRASLRTESKEARRRPRRASPKKRAPRLEWAKNEQPKPEPKPTPDPPKPSAPPPENRPTPTPKDTTTRLDRGEASEALAFEITDDEDKVVEDEKAPEDDGPIYDGDRTRLQVGDLDDRRLRRPAAFLPRMLYFENTYLGGNAAYQERLRRLDARFPEGRRFYRLAQLEAQTLDPPQDAGMALDVKLDQRAIDHPQRVLLQVGLKGSERFGWRRPPLDLVLVIDGGAPERATEAIRALLKRLDLRDRLGVVRVGAAPELFVDLSPPEGVRAALIKRDLTPAPPGSTAAALRLAGARLRASATEARVPGTQRVLLLTARGGAEIEAARGVAHDLNVQGVTTSIIQSGPHAGAWWRVASAGHGNHHRAAPGEVGAAVGAELESLSRVIARLLRVNIRLAPHVEAIRILGSRVLEQEEVEAVKAREVATDQNLSKTLGVTADRGGDDDGIQTVIPYFYGGDAHVILVELWVEKPGPVADVTLRYKDMVQMNNATARAAARLGASPRPERALEGEVARNARGFRFAEALAEAALRFRRGERAAGRRQLEALGASARLSPQDKRLVDACLRSIEAGPRAMDTIHEALTLASQRRIGE